MTKNVAYQDIPIALDYEDRVAFESLIWRKSGIGFAQDALARTAGALLEEEAKLWHKVWEKYKMDPALKYRVECVLGSGQVTLKKDWVDPDSL